MMMMVQEDMQDVTEDNGVNAVMQDGMGDTGIGVDMHAGLTKTVDPHRIVEGAKITTIGEGTKGDGEEVKGFPDANGIGRL